MAVVKAEAYQEGRHRESVRQLTPLPYPLPSPARGTKPEESINLRCQPRLDESH